MTSLHQAVVMVTGANAAAAAADVTVVINNARATSGGRLVEIDLPKEDPADIVARTYDGLEAGAYEILADETGRQVKCALSGPIMALYPKFALPSRRAQLRREPWTRTGIPADPTTVGTAKFGWIAMKEPVWAA